MSWADHSRRRAAVESVLVHAGSNPAGGLPFDVLPEVPAAFSSRRELMLALQYDWSQALWARIELLSLDPRSAPKDAAQLARTAWVDTARRHPVLRRLLDEHRDDLGLAANRERDRMVTAPLGLTCEEKADRTPYVA
ncbi:MAG TPA: hypothetical protein VGN18_05125 [Jatrophihabitans sp.]|jgi:hypothetical protein|uniref:hypothetical protein n=1 Tax=Jatrophihabitans sp. TaxID=1932789 RepID=UPI002E097FEC|nr:hypothetical protein [Jatrophihabitans sp.]